MRPDVGRQKIQCFDDGESRRVLFGGTTCSMFAEALACSFSASPASLHRPPLCPPLELHPLCHLCDSTSLGRL